MRKRLICSLLCMLMVCSLPLTAFAEEAEPTEETQPVIEIVTLEIETKEEFLTFAENCRLDSYSLNLAVTLKDNIDLTGVDFQGVPVFSGSFDGNGYSITGVSLTCSGSVFGLFRYLTQTAQVKNLTVAGTVQPQGSRDTVGGIAGSNAGKIESCSFDGTVAGGDLVGGIAGSNGVTGMITDCRVSGSVYGDHFVGGIAGENYGVIRDCENAAQVNTTPQQNSVDISEITIETLTGAEAADTVTDIGGIAGTSGGVIRDCENRGQIGYQHMGYNIGGIAGSQIGYIADCDNYGAVFGRKEVGGIVGHMEPATQLIYTEDTLQILEEELDTTEQLINRASANAQYGAASISNQVTDIEKQTQLAMDAVQALVPDEQSPTLPDPDAVLAAQNALSSSMSSIENSIREISASAQNMTGALAGDLQAISDQVGVMGQTVRNAPENLGGSVTDISDADTPEDQTGKIFRCTNMGQVLADWNAGGIAGAMAPENDLDPEEDIQISGSQSLNFDSELRAVIRNCKNEGTVTVTKQNGGGIAGWMAMGLVKDCSNSGALDGSKADYVGGIAGQSVGFIRDSSAKCAVQGDSFVGGIAGSADTVSDCRSMVLLTGTERTGAVLGFAEDREAITGNYYLAVGTDLGAVDGVSYDSCAQALGQEAFLELESLSNMFKTITIQFQFEDGTVDTVYVPTGSALRKALIPEIPEKPGYTACWEGLNGLYHAFDTVYYVTYTPVESVLQSEQMRGALPLLLAEGAFRTGAEIAITDAAQLPSLEKRQMLADSVQIALPVEAETVTVHYLLPENVEEDVSLLICHTDGTWQLQPYTVDGSYLIFTTTGGVHTLALIQNRSSMWLWVTAAVGCVALSAVVIVIVKAAKKRKKSGKENT